MDGAAESESQALLEKAQEAVRVGDWPAAKQGFETALARGGAGEALFGLGIALQWLGDSEAAIRLWERAYADFRRRRDAQQALLAAFYLCLGYRMIFGNEAASRGWCERAASVVEDLDAPELKGWVKLARAYVANESGRPHEGERHARAALGIARETSDSDLELCTKSELGAALVATGHVEEGTGLLDEAMAGALAGEGNDLDTVVLISCRTVASCDRGGDVRRATQWVRAADEFNRRYGSPHLYTTCRTHYGGILFAAGRWAEAERELRAALEVGKAAEPDLHAEALARFAQLRLAQGRTEEAARLLEGYTDHRATAGAIGAIRLARDEPDAAVAVLRRQLSDAEANSLEGAALSELLIEAEIARGTLAEASAHADELVKLASRVDSGLANARAQRALGRARAAAGAADAIAPLEAALASFRRLGMPFEAAKTRLLIATALAEHARKTAEHHVGSVLSKLELASRSEATAYAVRHLTGERGSATK